MRGLCLAELGNGTEMIVELGLGRDEKKVPSISELTPITRPPLPYSNSALQAVSRSQICLVTLKPWEAMNEVRASWACLWKGTILQ